MFIIEYIDFLGEIKNDTDINGKSFIFKIVDSSKEISFEIILFVHENVPAFITVENDEYAEFNSIILDMLLKQFNINDLLEFKNTEDENN